MEVLFLMMMVNDRHLFVSGAQVEKAHNADLHCVDWNPHDQNFILTGYFLSLCFSWFINIRLWICEICLGFFEGLHLLQGDNETALLLILLLI